MEEEEEYLDAVEMQSTEFDSDAGSRGEGGENDVKDEVKDGGEVDEGKELNETNEENDEAGGKRKKMKSQGKI